MSGRQDESIAIWPRRIQRVVPHDSRIEDVTEWSQRQSRSLVSALGSKWSVERETADDVDSGRIECVVEARSHDPTVLALASSRPFFTLSW